MSNSYSFCPQSPSFLAMKYLRTYMPRSTTLMPGERYRLHLEMESRVAGYKELNREMRDLSVEIDSRRRMMMSPDRELTPYCAFSNSGIGYTSSRHPGNQWKYDYTPSKVRFSASGNPIIREKGMESLYRYYATHRSKVM